MTENQLLQALIRGASSLRPLDVQATRFQDASPPWGAVRPDALVTASWNGTTYEFVAELKARSIPKLLVEAIAQARQYAAETGRFPMVVMPYLRPEQLDTLAKAGVSGLDLCGNGVVVVPQRLFVYRTGQPNRYRESVPSRYAYRGATSLVPRVFLCRAAFSSSSEVQQEIRNRGGEVAASTISKALKRMEEDLIVSRQGRALSLLQAETLLDKLQEAFVAPRVDSSVRLKLTVPWQEFLRLDAERVADGGPKLVLSGLASAARWAVAGRADVPIVYSNDVAGVLAKWLPKPSVSEDDRFPDVEIRSTQDPVPFFDARSEGGIPYASPVQTFLELSTGDKRDRETATQVREKILAGLRDGETSAR